MANNAAIDLLATPSADLVAPDEGYGAVFLDTGLQLRVKGADGNLVPQGAGGSTPLPPLVLTVTSNGQTVWNIGGSETRNVLFINGVRYKQGTDYTISLPNLTWISSLFSITTTDELLLTQ